MSPITTWARRLAADRRGATAFVFAAFTPVLLGAGALAVDMAHYRFVDNRLQSAADSAALAGVKALDDPAVALSDAVEFAQRNVPDNYGTVTTAADVTIGVYNPVAGSFTPGGGAAANAVRVTAERSQDRGNAAPRILSAIFDLGEVRIAATAIAARELQSVQYEPPEKQDLDSEAGDFNEVYAYCYAYEGTGSPASRRSQMTLIANNMPAGQNIITISGGVIKAVPAVPVAWPECAKDESLSFRLRNIRHAKSIPDLWKNPNKAPKRPEHNFYTDTVIADGAETFNLSANILETVRCDSLDACDPSKPGSAIPKGKNRTPTLEDQPCLPGKFMYFGWEDRPPGQAGKSATWTDPAWTDRDYDDIRLVMRCPRAGILGDGMSRLVG
jgi:hypothetical protein